MTTVRQYRIGGGGQGGGNPFGSVGTVIMLVLGLFLAYFAIKGIFTLLLWFSIPLFLGGVIMDPKGALSAGKSILAIAKKNPLIPVAVIMIAAIFYQTVPFIMLALTGVGLIAKSLIKKKVANMFGGQIPRQEKEEEDFSEYEEVEDDEEFLKLPEIEKQPSSKSSSSSNEYDNLFE